MRTHDSTQQAGIGSASDAAYRTLPATHGSNVHTSMLKDDGEAAASHSLEIDECTRTRHPGVGGCKRMSRLKKAGSKTTRSAARA